MRKPLVEPLETRIAPAFVTGIVNLADLAGGNGSKLQGANAGNFSGSAVSAAGDVNGDGFGDFVVGEEGFGLGVGAAAVIFGTAAGLPASVTLDSSFLNGTKGFRIAGGASGDRLGGAVSAAGDVNGDGFDDVIVGARFADGPGAAYVIFGKASGFAAGVAVANLDGVSGFKISGATAGDRAGVAVRGVGDVNGDGFADVLVGADGFASGKGAAFLIYGKAGGFAANLPLSGLAAQGVQFNGVAANDGAGVAVSGAGDVNADGFADVIIGAPKAEGGTKGAAYVVFGGATLSATIALSGLTGGNGFELKGVANNDGTGGAVSGAGDVNGDGFADVIVGASKVQGGSNQGAAYVVFGHAGVFLNVLTLNTLNGVNGFPLFGPFADDFVGASVSGAGDVNADGFDDIVIGAPHAGDVGDAYVIFGHASPFTLPLTLLSPDGAQILKLQGVTGEVGAGTAVSGAGDVNGDGFADLLVSNPKAGTNAGASYLVLGAPNGQFLTLPPEAFTNGGKTATFTDIDGDLVTVKVSKGTLTNSNFQLLTKDDPGSMHLRAQLLSLTLNADFADADVSITAKRAGGGDGFVNVGFINASGVDLGKVAVSGDLGRIAAGDDVNDFGVKGLTVGSFGLFGGRTGDTGVGLASTVQGAVGPLKVAGDFAARFNVVRAVGATGGGDLGGVTIAGSLIGGKVSYSGAILTKDRLGAVKVGGDLVGGAGKYSGAIYSGGAFGNLAIGGSMIGGAGADSGAVESAKDFGNVSVRGSLIGRGGKYSASIYVGGKLGNVSIGGSQVGGGGANGAVIESVNSMGQVRIAGDQVGGDGLNTAYIYASATGADIAGATIGGNARAGAGRFGGGIFAGGKLGPVMIAGDVLGTASAPYTIQGQGALTGAQSVAITSVKVGGDFTHGLIRAGFDGTDHPTNGHAQVGAISVGGDWIASSVTAGLTDTNAPDPHVTFGNGDDVFGANAGSTAVASIASVTIKGAARGTFETGDRYGIVAEQIGSVSVGGVKVALTKSTTADPANDVAAIHVGATPDFVVREVSRGLIPPPPEPPLVVTAAGPRTAQPASVALGTLASGEGFALTSGVTNGFLGINVASIGDLNGDGFDDVIATPSNTGAASAMVIFGKASGFPANLTAAQLDGSNGFRVAGVFAAAQRLGDFDGDGFDDLLVGNTNTAFLIRGHAGAFVADLNPATLDGTNGFQVTGLTLPPGIDQNSIARVLGGADVNGDGFADLIIPGSSDADAHVVFGRAGTFPASFAATTITGAVGFKIGENDNEFAGSFVAGLGDIDGDGFEEIALASQGLGGSSVFVIRGRSSFSDISLASFGTGDGFRIATVPTTTVGSVGDVNGDGLADILVSGLNGATRAAVIYGKTTPFAAVVDPLLMPVADGFLIAGGGVSIQSVQGAGDVNGDGFADLILGAQNVASTGGAYVIFGLPARVSGNVIFTSLNGADGFFLAGAAAGDSAGASIAGAGDMNGDGFGDVIVGASGNDAGGSNAGAAYVVFGGPEREFIDPMISADGHTATWTDVDGDLVTLKVSKTNAKLVLSGDSSFKLLAKSTADARAQLLALNLGSAFEGADVSLTAKRAGGGDGKVNVGAINTFLTDLGNVTVSGDLGKITVGDTDVVAPFKSLTVGSLGVFGALTQDTGGDLFNQIFGAAGAVKVLGDMRDALLLFKNGGAPGSAASVTVGGSVFGGATTFSGLIAAQQSLGPVKIAGDLVGGAGGASGYVEAPSITSLGIGGSMLGGAGLFSGGVLAGEQAFTGTLHATGSLGAVTIGGDQRGGAGAFSGSIVAGTGLGKVAIQHDQIGGAGSASALLFTANPGANITSVTIGGDARGGAAAFSGGLLAGGTLGPVSVKGDITGTAGHAYTLRGSGPLTVPSGVTKSVAITSLSVGGDFDHALVLAGYGAENVPANGHAQIGAITIGGDWIASNVIAALQPSPTATALVGIFGDGDDVFINAGPAGVVASIASITIKGRALGTLEVDTGFGILAEQIGAVKIGGVKLAFTSGTDAGFSVGPTPDFLIGEIARM